MDGSDNAVDAGAPDMARAQELARMVERVRQEIDVLSSERRNLLEERGRLQQGVRSLEAILELDAPGPVLIELAPGIRCEVQLGSDTKVVRPIGANLAKECDLAEAKRFLEEQGKELADAGASLDKELARLNEQADGATQQVQELLSRSGLPS